MPHVMHAAALNAPRRPARPAAIGAGLFLSLFTAQAAILALSPILPAVAGEFGVSLAAAGQLRSISGLAAGLIALSAGHLAARMGLRRMLSVSLLLLVVGSLASAAAPTFASLIAAQVVLGAGLAGVLTGAVSAAGRWPAPSHQARVLSWALNGQPTAWIVGMPLIGLVSAVNWRLAWLILPAAGGVLALTTLHVLSLDPAPAPVPHEVRLSHTLRQHGVGRWALGELLHYTAWSGTLVFAGALFVENLGAPVDLTGVLLGVGAAAYLPGNAAARRTLDGTSGLPLAFMAVAASATVALFGIIRGGLLLGTVLFAVLAFLSGARGFAGSIRGMTLAADNERVTLMSVRAAATQFGYLLGATLGGLGLVFGGYPGLAATLSVLFALAALPYLFMGAGVASAPDQPGPTHPARAILSPAGMRSRSIACWERVPEPAPRDGATSPANPGSFSASHRLPRA